jgi:hypothetical protein
VSLVLADTSPADKPSRWPLHAQTSDGSDVTIFQPQMDDFQGDTLTAHAAVAVSAQGATQPVYGAIWLQSRVSTDRVARTVHILDVQVVQSRFPDANAVSTPALATAVQQVIQSQDITLSLDQLLAMLETIQKAQSAAADLQNTPPAIIFLDHPSVKVQYDGTPRMVQETNSSVMRVVNTPFFVAMDSSADKNYYLKGAGQWFSAPDPMGPFKSVQQVPESISSLAISSGYKDPETPAADLGATGDVEIVTATTPTELIWSDGAPQMSTIQGTGLLYWANTASDVFLMIDSQQMYVLLSGRWYTAANKNGPWTYVAPDKLPADFSRIPSDSPKSSVLASVSGTMEAADAVADANLPQTAAVDTSNFQQPQVVYDGDPNFEAVPNTGCSYAVNCGTPIVSCNGTYYCCDDAVWYQAGVPIGPWALCRRVPHEIYTLPPSCPIYGVTFCHVFGFTPSVVYVGYFPGYVGCYAFNGVIVYGTGYHYAPWIGHQYFSRPATFGFSASYDVYSGHWGFNVALAAGGGCGWFSRVHTTEGRGGAWFGYGGYRPTLLRSDVHIDPKIIQMNNARIHRDQAAIGTRDAFVRNVYDRRPDVHQESGHIPVGGPDHAAAPAAVNQRPAAQGQDDLFSDQHGNVYRRSSGGGWEAEQKGQWKPMQNEQPHETPQQENQSDRGGTDVARDPERDNAARNQDLNRQYQARQAGENREREYTPRQEEPSRAPSGGEDRGGGGGGGDGRGDGRR